MARQHPAQNAPPGSRGRVPLGFGGLHASDGDHIGHFYRTRGEWRDVAAPFLSTGLERGEKCVCLIEDGEPSETLREALTAAAVSVEAAEQAGQLVIARGGGRPEALRQLLRQAMDDAHRRFAGLRWIGDMTWSLQTLPDTEGLMEWETACNTLPADEPVIFLCQYEVSRFPGHVVVDAMRTHPLCIIGQGIHENPYYEDPESFLAELRDRASAAASD